MSLHSSTSTALPRRVFVLVSPNSGRGQGRHHVDRLRVRLQDAAIDTTVTSDLNSLRRFMASDGLAHDALVTAGGDGTISLWLSTWRSSGIANANQPSLSVLPLGTENLLAKHYGYRADGDHCFKTLINGASCWIDLASVNDKPMACVTSCGFDAEVVRGVHLHRTGHLSRMTYVPGIMRTAVRYPFGPIRVESFAPVHRGVTGGGLHEIRGETIKPCVHECRWAMVFNLPRYATGLNVEPDADEFDGLLDVVLLPKGSLASSLRYFTALRLGAALGIRDVIRFRASHIRISAESRTAYQVDGDYAGRLPIEILAEPRSLRLRVPRT